MRRSEPKPPNVAAASNQWGEPVDTIRKTDGRPGRIAYEVAGLAWLAEASAPGAAVVPVIDHGPTWLEEPRLLSAAPTSSAAEEFGRALAHTHAAGASHLGAAPPGYAGDGWMGEAPLSLPQRQEPGARAADPARPGGEPVRRGALDDGSQETNSSGAQEPANTSRGSAAANPGDFAPASAQSWGSFYARERIAPYLGAPAFTAADRALIGRLCERLESGALDHDQPRLVSDAIARPGPVGAARTHGDLWSGNVMWTPDGAVLIDPAAQGGHAEEDLAALAVFGCPHLERITGRVARAHGPAPDAHHHGALRHLRPLLRARGRLDRPPIRVSTPEAWLPARRRPRAVYSPRDAGPQSDAGVLPASMDPPPRDVSPRLAPAGGATRARSGRMAPPQ